MLTVTLDEAYKILGTRDFPAHNDLELWYVSRADAIKIRVEKTRTQKSLNVVLAELEILTQAFTTVRQKMFPEESRQVYSSKFREEFRRYTTVTRIAMVRVFELYQLECLDFFEEQFASNQTDGETTLPEDNEEPEVSDSYDE